MKACHVLRLGHFVRTLCSKPVYDTQGLANPEDDKHKHHAGVSIQRKSERTNERGRESCCIRMTEGYVIAGSVYCSPRPGTFLPLFAIVLLFKESLIPYIQPFAVPTKQKDNRHQYNALRTQQQMPHHCTTIAQEHRQRRFRPTHFSVSASFLPSDSFLSSLFGF